MKNLTVETHLTEYLPNEIPTEYLPLIEEAKRQTQNSYAPYSQFRVGVALKLETGEIVTGNNQENAAYPSGTCAERTAVFYANSKYPESSIEMIAIAAYNKGEFLEEPITPCGACRQVLLETENRFKKPIRIILYGTKKTYVLNNVNQLLPLNFSQHSMNL